LRWRRGRDWSTLRPGLVERLEVIGMRCETNIDPGITFHITVTRSRFVLDGLDGLVDHQA
jgi:hypothetical protein